MHGNISERTDKFRVVGGMHVNLRPWELELLEGGFHLGVPLLHQSVDVGHSLAVVDRGGRARLVQVTNAVDPTGHLLLLFVGVIDRVDVHWSRADDVLGLDVLQL